MCDQQLLPYCFSHASQEFELVNNYYSDAVSRKVTPEEMKAAKQRLERAKTAYFVTEQGVEELRIRWQEASSPDDRRKRKDTFYYYKRRREYYLLNPKLSERKLSCEACRTELSSRQTRFCSTDCVQTFRKNNHVRKCKDCARTPDETIFGRHPYTVDGLSTVCKECNRLRVKSASVEYSIQKKEEISLRRKTDQYRSTALRRNYGIDLSCFNQLLAWQVGRCAICKTEFDDAHKPHVDHDHATGRVRGLLCRMCNSALGRFKDDIQTLNSARNYLKLSSDSAHSNEVLRLLTKRDGETRFNFIAARGDVKVSKEGRLRLLESQNFLCACCGDDLSHLNFRRIHIDHDHKTSSIRGALCNHCNVGIGQFYEDEVRFRAAIAYLVEHAAAA